MNAMVPENEHDEESLAVQADLTVIRNPKLMNGPREAPLMGVMVSKIAPRHGQAVMAALAATTSYDGMEHLKRIRKSGPHLEVLITRSSDWPHQSAAIEKSLVAYDIDVTRQEVPAIAPETKAEMREWRKVWPMNYKRARRPPPTLTPGELRRMAGHARRVRDFAESVAAVLVDPRTDAVLAVGHDTSRRAELPSAAGGRPGRIAHAVMECISQFARPHQRKAQQEGNASEQYLCTGLDMYTTREPCEMCAMALVHARIRRLIYLQGTSTKTAGITVSGVHQEARLNHRYHAYRLARTPRG